MDQKKIDELQEQMRQKVDKAQDDIERAEKEFSEGVDEERDKDTRGGLL